MRSAARGAPCHHHKVRLDSCGIFLTPLFSDPELRSSQDLTVRPQVFISGIRYEFTPAKRRYNPSYFVGTVEPVIDLQTAFAVRRRESGVLCRAATPSRKGTIAQLNSGYALWHACLVLGPHLDNDFVVSISNPNATGGTSPDDARLPRRGRPERVRVWSLNCEGQSKSLR